MDKIIDCDLHQLDISSLKEKLYKLNELKEEILEEREMIMGQSGHHIPSTRLFNDYKIELEKLSDNIELIKKLIQEKASK